MEAFQKFLELLYPGTRIALSKSAARVNELQNLPGISEPNLIQGLQTCHTIIVLYVLHFSYFFFPQ